MYKYTIDHISMNILISFIQSFNRANNLKLFITLEEAKSEFQTDVIRLFVLRATFDIRTKPKFLNS